MTIGYAQWKFLRRYLSWRISLGVFGDLFIQPQFVLQDFWIGVFWRTRTEQKNYFDGREWIYFREIQAVEVWICILPTLPLYVSWRQHEDDEVPF